LPMDLGGDPGPRRIRFPNFHHYCGTEIRGELLSDGDGPRRPARRSRGGSKLLWVL